MMECFQTDTFWIKGLRGPLYVAASGWNVIAEVWNHQVDIISLLKEV
jgi:hypothetical protein